MIGVSLAISIGLAATAQLLAWLLTVRPYRRHSAEMDAIIQRP